MKNQFKLATLMNAQPYETLNELVDQLMVSLLPRTLQQKSLIVNDVPDELFVNTDKNVLATIVSYLLNETVSNTEHNCIRVTAKKFGNITLVHVKNNDISHEISISNGLQYIQPMAEKLGGCISITSNKIKGTTIAFTFNNNVTVAA